MAEQPQKKLFADFPLSSRDEWIGATVQSLKGKPFEKLIKSTYENIDIQPMYCADDIASIAHKDTLPGQFPYVRGTKDGGYQSGGWLVAQEINLSDPQAFNKALKHDLAQGQTAIYISGNHIHFNSIEDMEVAFADIDLPQYPLFIQADNHANGVYRVLTAYLHNDDVAKIRGCIGYDPLHQLAKTGKVSASLFDLMADLIPIAHQQSPALDTIAVRSDVYHNAGANAVQEVAIAMATGVTYLAEMIERGLEIDLLAQKIHFFLNIGENFFMEIAKLRTVKMLWAQIVREFGGDAESQKIKLHVSTGLRNKTRLDPHVNMLRVTTEAMAGAMSGVDSLTVVPFDTPFGESDEFSRRIARNLQLILQEEVNLLNVIDPAGGSWYVEQLTDQLATSAWELFQQIEAQGGMLPTLQNGFIQHEIQAVGDKRSNNLTSRKDVLVGTNMYPYLNETLLEERNPLQNGVDDLSDTGDDNLIEIIPLKTNRLSIPFEVLRANADIYYQTTGKHPQIFLANIGNQSDYKARMDFAQGFFEVGGFELIDYGGYTTVDSAVRATLDSGASVVVICSTDDNYIEIVPEFTQALKAQKPEVVVILAGYPQDKIDEYRQAGIDLFIHIRANCYEINRDLQDRLGVGR